MIAARVVVPLVLALAGCVQPAEQTAFASRSRVHHPEALFDVRAESDQLRMNNPRRGRPTARRICPRDSDLKPYGALMAQLDRRDARPGQGGVLQGAAPVRPRADDQRLSDPVWTSTWPGRGATSMRCARTPAPTPGSRPSARIPPPARRSRRWARCCRPGRSCARRPSRPTTTAPPSTAGCVRVARFTDIHPGGNSVGTQRGTNDMMLGLIVGDDAPLPERVAGELLRPVARPCVPTGASRWRPIAAARRWSTPAATSRSWSMPRRSACRRGSISTRPRSTGRASTTRSRFLLRADDDNALVDVYARANRNPGLGLRGVRAERPGHAVRRLLARLDQALHPALSERRAVGGAARQDRARPPHLLRHHRRLGELLRDASLNARAAQSTRSRFQKRRIWSSQAARASAAVARDPLHAEAEALEAAVVGLAQHHDLRRRARSRTRRGAWRGRRHRAVGRRGAHADADRIGPPERGLRHQHRLGQRKDVASRRRSGADRRSRATRRGHRRRAGRSATAPRSTASGP